MNTGTEKVWLKSYDKGVPESINYPKATVHKFLDEAAEQRPGGTAIIFFGKRISYQQLGEMVDRFAAGLQHLGVKKGDRIALFLPNCPQFVIAYYAILKVGAIVVPDSPLYVERELSHQLEDSGSKIIVTLDLKQFYSKVDKVKGAAGLQKIIVTGIQEYLPFPKNLLYPIVRRRQLARIRSGDVIRMKELLVRRDFPQPIPVSNDDTAVLLYTGGTTGVAKGACLTHRNVIANALQCRFWLRDIRMGEESFLTVLPVFHAFAMTTSLNLPVFVQSTMILVPTFDVNGVLELIHRYRPTLLMGVPAMYAAIIGHPKLARYHLSSLRFGISGADALQFEIQQRFERLTGCKLVEGYGLTEASPGVMCNPIYGQKRGLGIPLPDTLCEVVNPENGQVMPPGQAGELRIKGPQVMEHYYQNPTETETVLRDGWLYPGDMVRMDKDGYFEFLSRTTDMIKVQKTGYVTSYKVFPLEIEEVLMNNPVVAQAAVIGVPHPVQGQVVKAFVVLKPGENITSDELVIFCSKQLAEYKVPSEIEFATQLPRNMLGKVLRRQLREKELARTSG